MKKMNAKDKMKGVQVMSAVKMQKPGQRVNGKKYSADLEEYDEREGMKDNHPASKPADISQALKRAKVGYSKKPRVKPEKKKMR